MESVDGTEAISVEMDTTEPVAVQPLPSVPPDEGQPPVDLGYYLYKTVKKHCVAAETLALDVINTIHHPVISTMRDVTKHDFNLIFSAGLFKKEGTSKFEQCFICIGVMDYIATAIKNPLYADSFQKIESKVQGCVKKIFIELRRTLREWASSDYAEYVRTKDLVVKYLRGLIPYFKIINYDVSFSSAVNLLARSAVRHQKQCLKSKAPVRPNFVGGVTEERSALIEIATNINNHEESTLADDSVENGQEDPDDEMFDVLNDKSGKEKPTTAPIFKRLSTKLVQADETKKRKHPTSLSSPKKSASQSQNAENHEVSGAGVKRPSVESLEAPAKKICTEDMSRDSSNLVNSSQSQNKSSSPILITVDDDPTPPSRQDQPVKNAFVFLMNRQKELFTANKLKKEGKAPTTSRKSKSSSRP